MKKKGPEAFGPRARHMLAMIPLRWLPHDIGDIPRKFVILQVVEPLKFRHARWINKKRWQLLVAS